MQSNRDKHFVRKSQFGILFREKHNAKVIQLANDVRRKGEELPLETYWSILKRYEKLWNYPSDKLLLQSLPPEDLLNTYLWVETEVDLAYETRFRYRFVKGRLIENAGDVKAATQIYKELMDFIDSRKDWQKNYKNKCKEKVSGQLEKVSSEL